MPTQRSDGVGGSLPRFAVSACTTYHSTFAEDLANYRALDIDGIGLWEYKLPEGSDDETLASFQKSGLTATFCFPNVPGAIYGDVLFSEPRDPRERLARLKAGIRRLAKFKPLAVACLAGPPATVAGPPGGSRGVGAWRRAPSWGERVKVGLALAAFR